MSDVDDFASKVPSLKRTMGKQTRFEQRTLRKLLLGLEASPGLAATIIREQGDHLTYPWFCETHQDFPIMLGSYKLRKMDFIGLVKSPSKTPIWKPLMEQMDNYPDRNVGMVFAAQGDRMTDMVIHTCDYETDAMDGSWLVSCSVRMEDLNYGGGSTVPQQMQIKIEPLEGVIERVRRGWQLM